MRLSQILVIVILVIVLVVILARIKAAQRSKSSPRKKRTSSSIFCAAPHPDGYAVPSEPSTSVRSTQRYLKRENVRTSHQDELRAMAVAPTTAVDESQFLAQVGLDQNLLKSRPKPATVPTFARAPSGDERIEMSNHGYRFQVNAGVRESVNIPKNFSSIKQWEGMITGVYDQERCGSCWAFATCSSFTDRIRIQSKGKSLAEGDYLSPFHLAACMKCGLNGACPRVCEGNYLDDVLQYLVDNGAVAQSDIEKYSTQGEEYRCFDAAAHGVKPWKGKRKYRVNVYPPNMLTEPKMLLENETAIKEEIYRNGPVTCIIKVYVPMDQRNFYLYKTGIYGHGWTSEPKETDGYHAINIIGWGEEETPNGVVQFWIVRNSWGDEWGTVGLGRILRGVNFGMIESDIWAIEA